MLSNVRWFYHSLSIIQFLPFILTFVGMRAQQFCAESHGLAQIQNSLAMGQSFPKS